MELKDKCVFQIINCLLSMNIFYHTFTCLQISKYLQPAKLQLQHSENFTSLFIPQSSMTTDLSVCTDMCLIKHHLLLSGEKMQVVFTTQGQRECGRHI